jgi:outer membrane protein assembly factor BamB
VTALDPASGEVVRTYEGTERTEEILLVDGTLFVVTGDSEPNQSGEAKPNRGGPLLPFPRGGANKRILAFTAAGGKVLWKKADQDTESLFPMTTAIDSDRIVFQNSTAIVCANRENGKTLWRVPQPAPDYRHGWSSPTLLVHDGVVLSADRRADPGDVQDYFAKDRAPGLFARWGFVFGGPGRLVALSLEDGKQLWQAPCAEGFNSPIDVFVARGLVWSGQTPGRYGAASDYTEGRNLRTGNVEKRLKTDEAFTPTHHHRCYRDRIVDNHLVMGRTGIEFIDLDSGECLRHNWVRGVCQYGVVPANGLLYAPPHACACYIESMIHGFYALAPAKESRVERRESRAEDRLERGPAYHTPAPSLPSVAPSDWPTYRHDAARSGRATTSVPTELEIAWKTKLGSDLGSPVVAGGLVFVPAVNAGAIYAIDAANGAVRWTFRADGRIDSPPTICRGLALFGSAGGWVYCLRAADGELVWRFRAAPEDKHTVAFDRVESLWPMHGSTLVHRNTLYCTAGRSSYLDGGMYFYQLDPASGEVLSQRVTLDREPESGRQPEERIFWLDMPGVLPDILSADGDSIYMRQNRYAASDFQPMPIGKNPFPVDADQSFNLVKDVSPARWAELYQGNEGRHLYSPGGFLNGSWYHRAYWIYGSRFTPGWAGWHKARDYVPAGRILAMDEENIYGYGEVGPKFRLFSVSKKVLGAAEPVANSNRPQRRAPAKSQGSMKRSSGLGVKRNWVTPSPMQVRGIVATDDLLYVAGHPDYLDGDVKAMTLMRQAERGDAAVSRRLQDQLAAWDGVKGGLLHAVSCGTGELKAELKLDSPPVWDGMAAANGRLFLSAKDGSVLCLGGRIGLKETEPTVLIQRILSERLSTRSRARNASGRRPQIDESTGAPNEVARSFLTTES